MKRVLKQLSVAACAILWVTLLSSSAFAQCAMCRAAAATAGNEASSSLNLAILVLLIPPVIMFCAIFVVAYRLRAAQGETQKEERTNRPISHGLYPPLKHSPFSK